jgi:NAD-dependent dihydropyrimidine dehydrogenase PreA subunit
MPSFIDKPARYLKYVVLVVFVAWSWQAATLVIRPYDPWVAWMHLTSPEVLTEFWVGLIVLGVSLLGSVVYDRFFCKYLCPMGGFLGAISRLSIFKVRRNESTCIDCKACDKVCPVNVTVSTVSVVNDAECIDCGECVNVCPVKDTLEVSTSGWPRGGKVLQPLAVLGIVIAIIAFSIGVTTATGSFAWKIPALSETVEKAGTVNVEEIKGSMTFAEISKATGIPEAKFQEKFGVKPGEMQDPIKDLASSHSFDVHTDVREFIAEQLGQAK